MVALVHRNVRTLLGLPPCGGKQLYSPEDWPDCDPVLAPNGYFHDDETNAVVWRPNWDNLKCSFFPNLINAAVDICLQDSSVSTMPSREELCRRVKEYLEGIAKMKKKNQRGKGGQPAPEDVSTPSQTPETSNRRFFQTRLFFSPSSRKGAFS